MDTGSHLLFGATLAGLAMLDPVVAGQPQLAHAVLAGTLIGSHAPDFDTLTRLKGFTAYLKHHRGLSHALPALFVWPVLVSLPLAWIFGVQDGWLHLFAWTMAAVCFHVFLDAFNAYGVQCFRPITRKWVHLDILCLYEPFLFGLHAAGLAAWLVTDWPPGPLFAAVYASTFAYIALRALHHRHSLVTFRKRYGIYGSCHLIPTLNWFRWQYIVEQDGRFQVGLVCKGRMESQEILEQDDNPAIQATRGMDGVRAFLQFAQRIHVSCKENEDGYEVKWSDVRFSHRHKLSFGVDVKLDRNLRVISQRAGYRKKGYEPPYI
ncbi:metal-dependent hydrolase [Xylanibacillus composti]|uniref:Metal-dependent hydrolase n=1 Tax=Xylanibacillus composti TaxID=1572762 RepID=A0A8J4GZS4_9BACL|nr:metal-dependent hydrolase [Xylanibacillus composti]MDT9724245.1 metal-dependent hydrolase [Xylanibacillus composti]GIQ68237.1 metal-dependent hydrolase [Xylanibacillus composti]